MRQDYTHISIILDRSGSMGDIAKDMEGGLAKFISDQKKEDGKCTVSLYRFDGTVEKIYDFIDIQAASNFKLEPRGSTSLNDAVGYAIKDTGQKLAALKELDRPSLVSILIITDGGENSSKEYRSKQIQEMIEHQTANYNWQFTYLGAKQDAFAEGSQIGVQYQNIANFSVDKAEQVWGNYSGKMSGARGMSAAGNSKEAVEVLAYTEVDRTELS